MPEKSASPAMVEAHPSGSCLRKCSMRTATKATNPTTLMRTPSKVAMRNATPSLEVKPRRVGGSTYQVPGEIKGDRRTALAMRWLIRSARARTGKSMVEKLAAELVDASRGVGATVKRREDTHKMAEANKAYAHYRW